MRLKRTSETGNNGKEPARTWRDGITPSKSFTRQVESIEKRRRWRLSAYMSGLKIAAILVLSLYALHLPALPSLPHADVLLVDVTGIRDDSRTFLYSLLDEEGLTHVTLYSIGIENLRLLTTGGYRYIIIWAHSGINDMATTEVFSPLYHVAEQLTGQVGRYHVNGHDYFSFEPGLVTGMAGSFSGTTVLLMGCNTMTQSGLAQAFIGKGASTVIGWRGLVSLTLANMFVVTYFQKILSQNELTKQAVSESSSLFDSMGITEDLTALYSN